MNDINDQIIEKLNKSKEFFILEQSKRFFDIDVDNNSAIITEDVGLRLKSLQEVKNDQIDELVRVLQNLKTPYYDRDEILGDRGSNMAVFALDNAIKIISTARS